MTTVTTVYNSYISKDCKNIKKTDVLFHFFSKLGPINGVYGVVGFREVKIL